MTASPISDLNPVLMASGSKLTLISTSKLLIFLRGTEVDGIVVSPFLWNIVRSKLESAYQQCIKYSLLDFWRVLPFLILKSWGQT